MKKARIRTVEAPEGRVLARRVVNGSSTRRQVAAERRRALQHTLPTVHIVASVSLVGSSIELLLAALRAARSTNPVQAHTFYELVRLLTFALGVPLSDVLARACPFTVRRAARVREVLDRPCYSPTASPSLGATRA